MMAVQLTTALEFSEHSVAIYLAGHAIVPAMNATKIIVNGGQKSHCIHTTKITLVAMIAAIPGAGADGKITTTV